MALSALQRAARKEQEEKEKEKNLSPLRRAAQKEQEEQRKRTTTDSSEMSPLRRAAQREQASGQQRPTVSASASRIGNIADILGRSSSKPVANNNAAGSTTTTQPKQFYKPPEFWTDKDKLYTPVQELEPTYKEKQAQLEQAQAELKKLEDKVRRDPSDQKAYSDYERAYGGYQALAKEYEPIFSEYKAAVDAYNAYVDEQSGLYNDWRSTVRDRESVEAAIAELERKKKDIRNKELPYDTAAGYSHVAAYDPANLERKKAAQEELDAIQAQLDALNEELDYSKYFSFAELADAEDFAERSKAEGSKQSGNFFTRLFDSDAAAAYDYINNVEGYNETMQELNKVYGEKYDLSTRAYDFMDEDQVSTFNYLYNTQGAKAAEDYLDWLQEGLNYELGQHIAAGKDSTFEKLAYGVKAGVDQFDSGMKQFFMSDRLPTSSTQFASQAIRESLGENGPTILGSSLGQLGYDAITTTANMAPSILLSTVTGGLGAPAALAQGLGSASMGLSASGAAYNRKLAEGKNKEEARTYATLIGLAEGGLQYVLGGISSLGGTLPTKVLTKIDMIDNVLARIAATGAVKIGSEVIEEELQNYIDPLLNTLIFDEKFDAPNFEELAYTALLTALTTGLMESGNIASAGSNRNAQQGAEFKNLGDEAVKAIIDEGLASDPSSKSYQAAEALQKKLDRGETISDHELGTLYQQNVEAVEAENAAQERVSRENVSTPVRNENVAPSSNLEAAAMEMAQEEIRRVQRAESLLNDPGYGEHGTSAFREIVEESGRDPAEVRTEFQRAYEAGRTGQSRNQITVLNPVEATAYNAGQRDLIADQARDNASQAKGVKVSGKAGFDSTGVPKDVTKAEVEVLDRLFKAVGVHGHMAGNQSYNAKLTGSTDVAIANDFQREVYDSKGNVVRTFTIVDHGVHEAGLHQAMKLAPVQMRAFINDFYSYLNKDTTPAVGTLAEQKQAIYGEQDVSLTLDKAMEEVTANQVFATLYGSDVEQFNAAMDRVMNGKNEDAKKGARTFLDVLSDLWKKVKAIAAQLRNKGDVKTAREVEQSADAIKELRDKYEAALRVAVENAAKAEKNTAQQDGVQYNLKGKSFQEDKYFARQMDNWDNLADGARVKVGVVMEGSALNRVGLPTSGMYFDVGKIRKSMSDHSDHLTPAVLKGIPDLLNDPVVIVEYTGNKGDVKNTVNVYGNLFVGNTPVVVGIVMRLDSSGRNIINNVRTIHARSNFAKQITDKSVLYLNEDKKRTRKWFHDCGNLNVPLAGTQFGLIRSITFEEENVKSEAEEQFSLVEDAATLEFLNNQKHVKVYRAMQEIDGKLYPPMAALVKGETGKKQLVEATKKGAWYQADERPDLIKLDKNGKPKFELNKGNGGMVPAAYNPYFHTSASPLNDQFSSAYDRPNIVVVEGYIPSSELTSGYKAQYAKDTVGETAWHAGPVASKLKGDKARRVFLSRWFKAERVVPVDEVAQIVAKTLDGENVSVPWNVVTPSLRKALEAEGVAIDYKDVKMGNKTVTFESTQYSLKEEDGITTATNKDGDVVAETHEDGSTMFSLKTYEDDGRAYLNNWLGKKVKSGAITQEEADDITRQMDEFYDICQKFTDKYGTFGAWSEAEVVKGKDGKPAFSVVKANGDYAMNLDFSLVCKKRRTLDAVFREMINRGTMDNVELGEEQIAKINAIIRDSGFETACALCFVDSKRYRQAMVADNFVNMYNELVEMMIPAGSDVQAHRFDFLKRGVKNSGRALHSLPDSELGKGIVKLKKVMQEEPSNRTVRYKTASHLLNNPQDRKLLMRSEFMNTDGFEAVTVSNRKVLGLYNSSKGSGGPKASLSDVQYLGDILKKSNFTPARAYAVGGVRIQSFSDYVPRLVFDYLQMIADLSAKKLPAHAYTKEEMFALQFGMTGIKVNLSLVPAVDPKGIAPGLDADGNYVWYDGQSFGSDVNVKGSGQTGFKRAVEIQNAAGYSANCGTIAVGISDEHIWKMLDDDDIRMIIPYHKSSLNHIVAVLNNIDKYTDYTGVQNTRYKSTGSKIDGKDFNFNEALRRLGDAKAAADEYLAWCEKNEYLPKFDEFAGHENYYKLLEDFSTYDNGVATPQGPVTMTFPKEGDAFGSMAQLIEQGLDEDAVLEGRRQSQVPAIVDKIEAVYREGGMEKGAQFSLKEQGDLMRENAKLKEVNQALQEQLQVTKFAKVDKKSLERFTKQLLKDYSSTADVEGIQNSLDGLYTYLANGEEGQAPSWEQAYRMAYDTAQSVLENASEVNDELYMQYKSLRTRLRNTAIRLDRSYEHDMGGYENLEEFRRANFGRIKLAKDGIPVDTLYQELAATYPELFDESEYSHPGNQLAHIAEVLADLQPYEWNPYSRNMREAATWLADDIMERFFSLPQAKPTFADKAERKLTEQVIKDAKKLEALRTQKNERIAQLIREGREKVKTAQAKERSKRQEAVKEVKEHYKAKEKKMSESRKASVLRAKIERHAGDLQKKLLRGTDKQHIPQGLQGAVAELLASINLESNYSYDPETGSYRKSDEGLPTRRTEAFRALREQYEAIAANNDIGMVIDPNLLGVPTEGIKSTLDMVIAMKDKRIADMTIAELETVWDVLRVIEHSVTTAGKMLSKHKWETTEELATAFMDDTASRRTKRSLTENHRMLDIETPYTFFSHFGQAGRDFYRMLRNAQDQEQVMQDELKERLGNVASQEVRKKAEKDVEEFTTQLGEKLVLSKAHIMEIYLLNKRPQAQGHLLRGGIVQPKVGKVRKGSEAILLNEIDIANITSTLTEKERSVADGLQKLTLRLAEWGNEASMTVYGYEKFKDPNYWTIRSSNIGINETVEAGPNRPRAIANMGSAKAVTPEASNTLDINGAFDTFDRHASDMLCYSAWLATMEDANRLFNYRFRDEDWNPTGKTIKGVLKRVSGEGSENYWTNLMTDIQNGLSLPADTATEQGVMKAIGNVKKASVSGNIRVVAQQPTAYLRAAAVLDIDLMLAAAGTGVAIKPALNGWKKAVKLAPIAARKAAGGYEIGSNPKQLAELLYQPESKLGKGKKFAQELPLAGAAAMDAFTWGVIWNACELQVARDNKDVAKGTDAFDTAVKELFTEVIDQTQVVDGVLQRSQAMRSGSNFMKQMTSFTGEPTQGANIVIRAYDQLRYETDPKKRSKAIKQLGRTVGVYTFTAVLNAFAQSLVDGLRDDDDEEYWKKVWAAFTGINGKEETWWDYARNVLLASNVTNNLNPATWLPVWKDALSLIQGYSVERMDAASMGDFFDAVGNTLKSASGEGKYTTGYAALKALVAGGKLFGSSGYNILRDVESIVRTFQVATDDYMAQYKTLKLMTKPENNLNAYASVLFEAYENDPATYKAIYDDLIESGVDAEKLASKMENLMKADQGVTKVDDLEQRYLAPSQQTKYDNALKSVQGSSVWKSANEEQRDGLEDDLYDLITQNSAGQKLQEDISAASDYGVSESEYLLWQLALDMNNVDGKGGYNTSEKAGALISMSELSDWEKAYLWSTKTTSDEVFDAFSAGVSMDNYFSFKAGLSELESGVDYKKGSAESRQVAIRKLLDSLGITGSDYNWLLKNVKN